MVVNRDDRVIIAIIEVLRGRRLVVVAIKVSDTRETASHCRIARPAVPRQCRVGADGRAKVVTPLAALETMIWSDAMPCSTLH